MPCREGVAQIDEHMHSASSGAATTTYGSDSMGIFLQPELDSWLPPLTDSTSVGAGPTAVAIATVLLLGSCRLCG